MSIAHLPPGLVPDQTGARPLAAGRCHSLLRSAVAGHLALSQAALPVVMPVTCAVDGRQLLVRASVEPLGLAAVGPGIVAFQTAATAIDGRWRCEVMVRGPASLVAGLVPAEQAPPMLAFVPLDGTVILQVGMELVTGWQYTLAPQPSRGRTSLA